MIKIYLVNDTCIEITNMEYEELLKSFHAMRVETRFVIINGITINVNNITYIKYEEEK